MRPSAVATVLALLAATPLPAASLREDGEKQLADLIKGRVAGAETNCIPQWRGTERSWNINRIGVVYEVGTTRYVMRFQDGCDQLDQSALFATTTPTGLLCSGDMARVFTNTAGPAQIFLGTCIVGRFTPYKREG